MTLFIRSLKEFFTPKFLKLTLVPFLGTAFIMIVMYLYSSNSIDTSTNSSIHITKQSSTIKNGKIHTDTQDIILENSSIIDYLKSSDFGVWFSGFDLVSSILSILSQISILIAVMIISFMTPKVIQIIGKNYYPNIQIKGYSTNLDLVWMMIKSISIMMILFIVLVPFYFIPYLNSIAFNLPLFYFFHKMLVFDVGSSMMGRFDYASMKIGSSSRLRTVTLISYIISLVPLVGAFFSLFYVIWLTFTQFEILQQKN